MVFAPMKEYSSLRAKVYRLHLLPFSTHMLCKSSCFIPCSLGVVGSSYGTIPTVAYCCDHMEVKFNSRSEIPVVFRLRTCEDVNSSMKSVVTRCIPS